MHVLWVQNEFRHVAKHKFVNLYKLTRLQLTKRYLAMLGSRLKYGKLKMSTR